MAPELPKEMHGECPCESPVTRRRARIAMRSSHGHRCISPCERPGDRPCDSPGAQPREWPCIRRAWAQLVRAAQAPSQGASHPAFDPAGVTGGLPRGSPRPGVRRWQGGAHLAPPPPHTHTLCEDCRAARRVRRTMRAALHPSLGGALGVSHLAFKPATGLALLARWSAGCVAPCVRVAFLARWSAGCVTPCFQPCVCPCIPC